MPQSQLLKTIRLSDNKGIFSQSMARKLPEATYSDYVEESSEEKQAAGGGNPLTLS